jgi:hypothetical protein
MTPFAGPPGGYLATMSLPADHATGLELQIGELVEQKAWALSQGRDGDAAELSRAIGELQQELGAVATLALTGSRTPEPDRPIRVSAEALRPPEVDRTLTEGRPLSSLPADDGSGAAGAGRQGEEVA